MENYEECPEDFYNNAPCGYLTSLLNGKIININDTLLKILGYNRNDIVGKESFQDLLNIGGKMYYDTHYIPLLIHQKQIKEIRFKMVSKTGIRIPVLVNTVPAKTTNGELVYRSIVLDITQRNQYEKELHIAKEKAELLTNELKVANQELAKYADQVAKDLVEIKAAKNEQDVLVGIIAHDLKTPFNQIYSISDFIEQESEGEFAELYGIIKKIATNSSKMIENIVNINSYENNNSPPNLQIFDLEEFYNLKFKAFFKDAERKNIILVGSCSLDSNYFKSDESFLGRIIDNILSNAIKFSPEHKTIQFNLQKTDQEVIFTIEDEGPGFTKKDMMNTFQKFKKLSARPTGDESSTGLGLSIVKTLTKGLGGTISLDSKDGMGAKFTLSLPI